MSDLAVRLRLLASVVALAAGAAALAVVVALGRDTPGPVATSAAPSPAAVPGVSAYPTPPPGSIVFSRQDDANVLALALAPGTYGVPAQVSIVDGDGRGVSGVAVSVDRVPATSCGDGCYSATLPKVSSPVEVVAGKTRWMVALPERWPPRAAEDLLARASAKYRALETLTIDDRLASDATHFVETHWTIRAPDRLKYQVKGGGAAVIIGTKRWDKVPGGAWQLSASTPVRQPTTFWKSWTNAYVVGSTSASWQVTFFDPETPGWYAVQVDKRSLLPSEMRMAAEAHFMTQRFSGFDEPVEIAPPAG